jgi:hypothetical protein
MLGRFVAKITAASCVGLGAGYFLFEYTEQQRIQQLEERKKQAVTQEELLQVYID